MDSNEPNPDTQTAPDLDETSEDAPLIPLHSGSAGNAVSGEPSPPPRRCPVWLYFFVAGLIFVFGIGRQWNARTQPLEDSEPQPSPLVIPLDDGDAISSKAVLATNLLPQILTESPTQKGSSEAVVVTKLLTKTLTESPTQKVSSKAVQASNLVTQALTESPTQKVSSEAAQATNLLTQVLTESSTEKVSSEAVQATNLVTQVLTEPSTAKESKKMLSSPTSASTSISSTSIDEVFTTSRCDLYLKTKSFTGIYVKTTDLHNSVPIYHNAQRNRHVARMSTDKFDGWAILAGRGSHPYGTIKDKWPYLAIFNETVFMAYKNAGQKYLAQDIEVSCVSCSSKGTPSTNTTHGCPSKATKEESLEQCNLSCCQDAKCRSITFHENSSSPLNCFVFEAKSVVENEGDQSLGVEKEYTKLFELRVPSEPGLLSIDWLAKLDGMERYIEHHRSAYEVFGKDASNDQDRSNSSTQFLVFTCRDSCPSGIGDMFRGLVSMFYLAFATERIFLLDLHLYNFTNYYVGNQIDWDLRKWDLTSISSVTNHGVNSCTAWGTKACLSKLTEQVVYLVSPEHPNAMVNELRTTYPDEADFLTTQADSQSDLKKHLFGFGLDLLFKRHPEFDKFVSDTKKSLGLPERDYLSIHIRTTDRALGMSGHNDRDTISDLPNFLHCIDYLQCRHKQKLNVTWFLAADNKNAKNIMARDFPERVVMLDSKLVHSAAAPWSSIKVTEQGIKDMFMELAILSDSKYMVRSQSMFSDTALQMHYHSKIAYGFDFRSKHCLDK